jgi:hypothetical protein
MNEEYIDYNTAEDEIFVLQQRIAELEADLEVGLKDAPGNWATPDEKRAIQKRIGELEVDIATRDIKLVKCNAEIKWLEYYIKMTGGYSTHVARLLEEWRLMDKGVER